MASLIWVYLITEQAISVRPCINDDFFSRAQILSELYLFVKEILVPRKLTIAPSKVYKLGAQLIEKFKLLIAYMTMVK